LSIYKEKRKNVEYKFKHEEDVPNYTPVWPDSRWWFLNPTCLLLIVGAFVCSLFPDKNKYYWDHSDEIWEEAEYFTAHEFASRWNFPIEEVGEDLWVYTPLAIRFVYNKYTEEYRTYIDF